MYWDLLQDCIPLTYTERDFEDYMQHTPGDICQNTIKSPLQWAQGTAVKYGIGNTCNLLFIVAFQVTFNLELKYCHTQIREANTVNLLRVVFYCFMLKNKSCSSSVASFLSFKTMLSFYSDTDIIIS